MVNAANYQPHQVRLCTYIYISHQHILGSHQYQGCYCRCFPIIIFTCKKISIYYAEREENQRGQPVSPYTETKQLKTCRYHPEWKMWFIQPVAVITKKLKELFF